MKADQGRPEEPTVGEDVEGMAPKYAEEEILSIFMNGLQRIVRHTINWV